MTTMTHRKKNVLMIIAILLIIVTGCISCTKTEKYETDEKDTGETDLNATDYYVDINGSDDNPGTKDAPFRTLKKARDTVRMRNNDMASDIVIHIGAGVFELAETFELTAEDSGSNGYRIIYEGQGKDVTVISGGVEVTGWTLHDAEKNIYRADVPDGLNFRQLYVDGEKAIRARSGEVGNYDKRIIGAERIRDGAVLPELLTVDNAQSRAQADEGTIFISKRDATFSDEWGNLTDVELHIFTAWSVNILRVKSAELHGNRYNIKIADEEAELVFNRQHPNIDGYSHMSTRNFIYYVENAYELIDEDNEWYLDRQTNTVYYKAPKDIDLNEKTVTVPRLETIVHVNGTLDKPVSNVTFRNMSFQYSNWLKPSEEGFVDGQSMQYVTRTVFATNDVGVGRPAAGILVTGAHSIVFDNNLITNMGATGIDLFWGTDHCTVSNSEIRNISGNGVSIGKFTADDVIDFHIPYNPEDEREVCTGDMIVNNEIDHVGTDYECGVAIAAGYPKSILIANNTISYAPYTGISVGFGWTKASNAMSGNRIIRNEIHNVTTVLCDAGGIYTLSEQPNSEIWQNYIHDITLQSWADYGTSGIYLDEGTGGYFVSENVIERAYDINPHATGINQIYRNYINTTGGVDSEKADEIKRAAGVKDDFSLEELLSAARPSDPKSFTYETLLEDDFEGYESGDLISDLWTVASRQTSLVNIVEDSGNKFLKIESNNANTKVNVAATFGANSTTFDFMFPESLSNSEGMYNVIRRTSLDYTSNITPAFSTTVRLEAKGQNETGADIEIQYKTWYTCRTMVYENMIYMKIWKTGAEEPDAWDVIKDMNDAENGDCMLGLEFYSSPGKSVYIDNVKIAIIKER